MKDKQQNLTVERVLAQAERRIKRIMDARGSRREIDRARAILVAMRKLQDRLDEFDQTPLGHEHSPVSKPQSAVAKKKRRSAGQSRRSKRAA